MESARKRTTRVFEARLCHRMDALLISISCDQNDDWEEEAAYSPKNSNVTEPLSGIETVCGE